MSKDKAETGPVGVNGRPVEVPTGGLGVDLLVGLFVGFTGEGVILDLRGGVGSRLGVGFTLICGEGSVSGVSHLEGILGLLTVGGLGVDPKAAANGHGLSVACTEQGVETVINEVTVDGVVGVDRRGYFRAGGRVSSPSVSLTRSITSAKSGWVV